MPSYRWGKVQKLRNRRHKSSGAVTLEAGKRSRLAGWGAVNAAPTSDITRRAGINSATVSSSPSRTVFSPSSSVLSPCRRLLWQKPRNRKIWSNWAFTARDLLNVDIRARDIVMGQPSERWTSVVTDMAVAGSERKMKNTERRGACNLTFKGKNKMQRPSQRRSNRTSKWAMNIRSEGYGSWRFRGKNERKKKEWRGACNLTFKGEKIKS